MFTSLRSRLWLTYAILVGVVLVVVIGALAVYVARSNFLTRVQLTTVATRFLQRPDIPVNSKEELELFVDQVDENIDMRVIVLDRQGNVLEDSRSDTETELLNLNLTPGNQTRQVSEYEDDSGKKWLYVFRRVPNGITFVIATETQPIREVIASPIIRDLAGDMFWAGMVSLLIAMGLAYLISRWVAGPLQNMSGAARAVADGHRTQVELAGPDEVQALGQAFNEMTQRVHASQASQRDFVANVSHELKTPLTSVQGFAQAILDGTANTPEAKAKAAQVIYDESSRMHRLVLDLLDLARLDAGTADLERVPFELAVLLNAVAEKFIPQSRKANVELITNIGHLPGFIGDGDRLSQVFTNLVDNALKHTPSRGKVNFSAKQNGTWVEISVADNGPGIPPDELSRIFERFYQLDKSRKGGPSHGVGLGLAIAREIIHAHQGTLSAHSQVGEGSVFMVRLPVAQPGDDTAVSKRKALKPGS